MKSTTKKKVSPISITNYKINKADQFKQLAESDYLGFRQLCRLEQPALSLLLFSGEQCIEKYIKATFLLLNISIENLNHNLVKAWNAYSDLSLLLIKKTELNQYNTVIKEFNNADHTRYAAYDIKVDFTLHHRLDDLFIKVLRKNYTDIINKMYPFITNTTDYLQIILDNNSIFRNSYIALTEDNHALINSSNETITILRTVNYIIPTSIILSDRNYDKKNELEKYLGIKLSNSEFDKTYTITHEEVISDVNIEAYVRNRRLLTTASTG